MSLAEQLGNVGSEFDRAVRWKQKKQETLAHNALRRTLEQLDKTLSHTRNAGPARKEIARLRQEVCRELLADTLNLESTQKLQRYFLAFAKVARRMIHLDPQQFEPLGPISWPDVLAGWRADEEHQVGWQNIWREKGLSGWEAWRAHHIEPFGCAQRSWHLYRLRDPLASVPYFYGGPHKAWIKRYYNGENLRTFDWLASHTDILERATRPGDKIHDLLNSFPTLTTLIGFMTDQGVVILEGMHRCCALTVMAARHQQFSGEVRLALADARGETLPIVGAG